jgi:hypothetical protein
MQRNAKVSDRVYIYIYVINIFERVQMDEFMWQEGTKRPKHPSNEITAIG